MDGGSKEMKLLSAVLFLVTLCFLEPASARRGRIRYYDSPSGLVQNYLGQPSGYGYHRLGRHHNQHHRYVRWNKTDRRLMRLSYALRLFLNYKRTHPYHYREHKMAYRALMPVLQASHHMYLPPLRHYRYYRRMHRMRYGLMSRRRHRYHYYHMNGYGGGKFNNGYYNNRGFYGMMYQPRHYRRYHRYRYHYRPRWSRRNRRNYYYN